MENEDAAIQRGQAGDEPQHRINVRCAAMPMSVNYRYPRVQWQKLGFGFGTGGASSIIGED